MSPRIQAMQVAVYVMCGGGHLGRFAATQPAHFYIDDRAGRQPFGLRKIQRAVQALVDEARAQGLDPLSLEAGETLDALPNMGGVF